MFYAKVSRNTFLFRLFKGEEFVESLTKFCSTHAINNGYFHAIGSAENPVVAHYRVDTKKYTERKLSGIFEILSIQGNIGLFEGEPLVHAHGAFSDEEMKVVGGHVVKCPISATCEVVLKKLLSSHTKSFNDEIGLKLWDFPEEL